MIRVNVFYFCSHDCSPIALALAAVVCLSYIQRFVCCECGVRFWLICTGTWALTRLNAARNEKKKKNGIPRTDARTAYAITFVVDTANAQFSCKLALLWYYYYYFSFWIIFRFHLNWINGCFIKALFDFIVPLHILDAAAAAALDRLYKFEKEKRNIRI